MDEVVFGVLSVVVSMLDGVKKLGLLRDPERMTEALNLADYNKETLKAMLASMLLIRSTETAIATLVKAGIAKTPCHLCIGQEAIAVGVSNCLSNKDSVFSCHRGHGHFLALNQNPYSLIAEVLGKKTGCAKGMGGSMHLVDLEHGFYGSVPIVGATLPLAVGAALAEKLKGSNDVSVVYFGDGACEEGVLHESLNLAAIYQLPVLFVCENNLYSSHLDIDLRQPSDSTARFAAAHCIENVTIDGNDVLTIHQNVKKVLDKMRQGGGPAFLEAVTYRWLGHVGGNEDVDVGVNRKLTDIQIWKKRDPILRLYQAMVQHSFIEEYEYEELCRSIKANIDKAVERAQSDEYPMEEGLTKYVYSHGD